MAIQRTPQDQLRSSLTLLKNMQQRLENFCKEPDDFRSHNELENMCRSSVPRKIDSILSSSQFIASRDREILNNIAEIAQGVADLMVEYNLKKDANLVSKAYANLEELNSLMHDLQQRIQNNSFIGLIFLIALFLIIAMCYFYIKRPFENVKLDKQATSDVSSNKNEDVHPGHANQPRTSGFQITDKTCDICLKLDVSLEQELSPLSNFFNELLDYFTKYDQYQREQIERVMRDLMADSYKDFQVVLEIAKYLEASGKPGPKYQSINSENRMREIRQTPNRDGYKKCEIEERREKYTHYDGTILYTDWYQISDAQETCAQINVPPTEVCVPRTREMNRTAIINPIKDDSSTNYLTRGWNTLLSAVGISQDSTKKEVEYMVSYTITEIQEERYIKIFYDGTTEIGEWQQVPGTVAAQREI